MKKVRIFIDTNKYLDFYRASDHSLKMLSALINLIIEKKVELILPKQVINEFIRDKDIVFKNFIDENLRDVKAPGFMDKKQIEKVNKLLFKIRDNYKKKFYSPKSKINIEIKKLFNLAIKPEESNEILDFSYYRTLRGNPPRKNNSSFGDAIIWETLLGVYSDQDLTIISGDGDWSSDINKKEINPFLEDEWKQKKQKNIKLSDSLGEFINIFSKKEKIKKELIEEEKYYNTLRLSNAKADSINSMGQSIYSMGNILDINSGVGNPQNILAVSNYDITSPSRACVKCGNYFVLDNTNCGIAALVDPNRCSECLRKGKL